MKRIIIGESQKTRLFEAYREGFSFDTLAMLYDGWSNEGSGGELQMEYCEKYLGPVQNYGSSRCTFTLSDNMILKLAYGERGEFMREAGMEQNRVEFELYQKADTPLLPRIYKHDENFTFLVCESVVPAREIDFEQYLGVPFYGVYRQRTSKQPRRMGSGDVEIGFDKYFDDLKDEGEFCDLSMDAILSYIQCNYAQGSDDGVPNRQYEELIEDSWWLQEIVKLAKNYGMSDLCQPDNYGLVNRDGEPLIVVLDSGFNHDVWKNYYQ